MMRSRRCSGRKVAREIEGINAAARRWIVLGADESMSAKERSAMQQWIAADPRHEKAYRQERRVWDGIGQLSHLRGSVRVEDLKRCPFPDRGQEHECNKRGRTATWAFQLLRRPAVLAPGLVAAVAFAAAIIALKPSEPEFVEYGSRIGEIRDIELPDGTAVTLGANSGIRVRYSRKERAVWLDRGEAYIDAASDPERPFAVDAHYTAVLVTGTQFSLRRGSETVDIAVAEGVVQVSNTREGAVELRQVTLTGGQRVSADHRGNLGAVRQVGRETVGAWRTGRFFYENTRLAEVIADVNRYSPRRIQISPMSLGDMRISGSFSSGETDQILVKLQRILPIRVVEYGRNQLLLTRTENE